MGVQQEEEYGYEGVPQNEQAVNGLVYINAKAPESVRHEFRMKVIFIVFLQMLFTAVVTGIMMIISPFPERQSKFGVDEKVKGELLHKPIWMALWLGGFACWFVYLMTACCCSHLLRIKPWNYILTAMITFFYTSVVALSCCAVPPATVMMAVTTTCALVFGVGLYAMKTDSDWTGCGPYLIGILIGMMCFSLVVGFVAAMGWISSGAIDMIDLMMSFVTIILFSIFLIYDIQMIMGGANRTYQYSTDDYCLAATNLYADIIIIFLEILKLLNRK